MFQGNVFSYFMAYVTSNIIYVGGQSPLTLNTFIPALTTVRMPQSPDRTWSYYCYWYSGCAECCNYYSITNNPRSPTNSNILKKLPLRPDMQQRNTSPLYNYPILDDFSSTALSRGTLNNYKRLSLITYLANGALFLPIKNLPQSKLNGSTKTNFVNNLPIGTISQPVYSNSHSSVKNGRNGLSNYMASKGSIKTPVFTQHIDAPNKYKNDIEPSTKMYTNDTSLSTKCSHQPVVLMENATTKISSPLAKVPIQSEEHSNNHTVINTTKLSVNISSYSRSASDQLQTNNLRNASTKISYPFPEVTIEFKEKSNNYDETSAPKTSAHVSFYSEGKLGERQTHNLPAVLIKNVTTKISSPFAEVIIEFEEHSNNYDVTSTPKPSANVSFYSTSGEIQTNNVPAELLKNGTTKISSPLDEVPSELNEYLNNYDVTSTPKPSANVSFHSRGTSGEIQTNNVPAELIKNGLTMSSPLAEVNSELKETSTSKMSANVSFYSKGTADEHRTNNLTERDILFGKFRTTLDRLERKFLLTVFTKLTAISPVDRKENGISFLMSGFLLYHLLMSLTLEKDQNVTREIEELLGLHILEHEVLEIIERTALWLPKSSDILKFRWSSRLVVVRERSVSGAFRRAAHAMHMRVSWVDDTGTPRELTQALNDKVVADTGGAMHDTFDEEEFSEGVCAVALATAYVRATWRVAPTLLNGSLPFRDAPAAPARTERFFRLNDIMGYAYLHEWDAEAIEISYATPGLTLLILVPKNPAVRPLVERAANAGLNAVLPVMTPMRLAVTLPLYTLRMTLLLPNKLQNMGLSSLIANGTNCQSVQFSHAVQRLMFWAEAGRNAYKDDGIEWDPRPELEILVDRPYLFYVRWQNITIMNGVFVL